jgi:hypothetical protein
MEADVPIRGMYVATVILFAIPCSIVSVGWIRAFKAIDAPMRRDSRSNFAWLGLIAATFATVTAICFEFSWTHNGGSPHGMGPGPGLWLSLRRIAIWAVASTIVLGAFARGKVRLLIIGSAISIVIVDTMLAMLEME